MTDQNETEANESGLSVTLKAGSGFNAPWVVVRGEHVNQVDGLLREVHESDLLQHVSTLAVAFGKLYTEAGGVIEPRGTGGTSSAPAQPQAAPAAPTGGLQRGTPHPAGKTCDSCGTVLGFIKSGTGQYGPYNMFACPNGKSRGDGHGAAFVKTG